MESETFDRGLFAGPFGWISGCAAEFAVAIRSALVSPPQALSDAELHSLVTAPRPEAVPTAGNYLGPTSGVLEEESASTSGRSWEEAGGVHRVSMFAGVGIVRGSEPLSEWRVSHLQAAASNFWKCGAVLCTALQRASA